jgi:hypothetical protein
MMYRSSERREIAVSEASGGNVGRARRDERVEFLYTADDRIVRLRRVSAKVGKGTGYEG